MYSVRFCPNINEKPQDKYLLSTAQEWNKVIEKIHNSWTKARDIIKETAEQNKNENSR